MIFVTVGSELPFDRLVRAMDAWAREAGRTDVFAQIGGVGAGGYRPAHMRSAEFVSGPDYTRRFQEAELVVAHAGMGSIITALTLGRPILVMPRRADLRETRSDHQVATAERFAGRANVFVAADDTALPACLDRALAGSSNGGFERASSQAARPLIETLRGFIGADR